mgnify:CR=1 FL=1
MIYVLLINDEVTNQTGATLQLIEKNLKTEFKSYDYMLGFFDGYLFEDYKILTLEEYQTAVRKQYSIFNNKYMLFVEVLSLHEED